MSKKILGIVAEYNPFHNGHKYHIDEAIRLVSPDIVVCAMSGNFVQRGEPAIFNKFSRAQTAINNGVDIVVEIPTYFAVSTAENFAFSAVSLLKNMGVTHIAFGVESNNLDMLNKIADFLISEPEEYKIELKTQLNLGLSFANARDIAISKFIPNNLLKSPNNILAVEYLKAIKYFNANIIPVPIKRTVDYYETNILNNVTSATNIRELLKENKEIANLIPSNSIIPNKKVFLEDFEKILLYKLKISSVDSLNKLPDVIEGLENRILNALSSENNINCILNKIVTKRYTLSRIKRIFISLLLDITNEDVQKFKENGYAEYIRILAMSSTGKKYLPIINKVSDIPVITSIKKFLTTSNEEQRKMINMDILAYNIYSVISDENFNMDFQNRL